MNQESSFKNKPMLALAILFFIASTCIFLYAVVRLFGGAMELASILTIVGVVCMILGTFFLSRSQKK